MTEKDLIRYREHSSELPYCAWPGGYTVVYVMEDGAVLCSKCANNENGSLAYVGEPEDGIHEPMWHIIGADVYDEGPPLECAHCWSMIESSYGDPESE
jgi:hypothetical protein